MNALASTAQLRASTMRWALLFVPLIVLLGILSAKLSGVGGYDAWFAALSWPRFAPRPTALANVWTVLYIPLAVAVTLVASARGAPGRGMAVVVFFVLLVLSLAWLPVFFAGHALTAALILIACLDLAVLATAVLFWRVRRLAAIVVIPYLVWALFITLLSWTILQTNPDLDGKTVSGAVERIAI